MSSFSQTVPDNVYAQVNVKFSPAKPFEVRRRTKIMLYLYTIRVSGVPERFLSSGLTDGGGLYYIMRSRSHADSDSDVDAASTYYVHLGHNNGEGAEEAHSKS